MTLQRIPIPGPYKGVVSDMPTPGDLQAFDDIVNFFCRKGRMHTRPRLEQLADSPDGKAILKLYTFRDVNNVFHTLMLTTENAYFVTAGPVFNPLAYPVGIVNLAGTNNPWSLANILNRVYFVNGSVKLLYADGGLTLKVAGNVQGSGYFLAQNIQQLIMAPTIEPAPGTVGSTLFPNRVRWSASGLPNQWDSTVDFTAGFSDLVQVADIITALSTIGRNTYIYHKAGLIVMYPTLIGTAPFAFEDLSIALDGVGLEEEFAYTHAQYGGTDVFKAQNEIYLFDGSGFTPIGLGNKVEIFNDIDQASGVVRGRVIPGFGPGFDYLSYWLTIPGPNVTWVYSYDDHNWQKVTADLGYQSALDLVSMA